MSVRVSRRVWSTVLKAASEVQDYHRYTFPESSDRSCAMASSEARFKLNVIILFKKGRTAIG